MWLGIDFSGDAARWRPGTARTNVWIAGLDGEASRPRLAAVRPVQALPGVGAPFARLAARLRQGAFRVAAIDAPFSIPRAFLPEGGRGHLLRLVATLPKGDRPFPLARDLVAAVAGEAPLRPPKPWRRAEQHWRQSGVNVRSTLWAGPRGGAAFTAACLTLIAASGRPCWPWSKGVPGLLAEAFPAAQLRHWGLPHSGYARDDPAQRDTRRVIVAALRRRIDIADEQGAQLVENADALDAAIAALAAVAVDTGKAVAPPALDDEGWIAVHP